MVIFSPAGVDHAVFCKLEALTKKLNLEEKTYLITETGAKYTPYCVNSVSLYHLWHCVSLLKAPAQEEINNSETNSLRFQNTCHIIQICLRTFTHS